MGLFRYSRMGLLPGRPTLLRVGLPMGIESLIGAAAGGAFAGSTSADVLKLLLGLILIAAALKAFGGTSEFSCTCGLCLSTPSKNRRRRSGLPRQEWRNSRRLGLLGHFD